MGRTELHKCRIVRHWSTPAMARSSNSKVGDWRAGAVVRLQRVAHMEPSEG